MKSPWLPHYYTKCNKNNLPKKPIIGVPISNQDWIPEQLPMPLLTSIEKHGFKELTPLSLLHFSLFMCTKGKGLIIIAQLKEGYITCVKSQNW